MNDINKCIKWLWLSHTCDISKGRIIKLYDIFQSIDNIFDAQREDYEKFSFLKEEDTAKLCVKDLTQAEKLANLMNKKDITLITRDMDIFPDDIKDISNFPSVLYCKGNPKLLTKEDCISVVGSRTPGSYGKNITYEISRNLSRSGFTVISGMADGIDSIAHRAALDAGGYTVAVVGCGVDVIYPRGNYELAERICQNGMMISEYPPGTMPEKYHFPERNKIIAALSCATVVTEANIKSGSLITAGDAKKYNRDVFAVPGNITSKLSGGTNTLIKKGAIPVTEAEDICDFYGRDTFENHIPAPTCENPAETSILDALSERPLSIDEISYVTGLSLSELSCTLLFMEVKELIKKTGADLYTTVLK